MAKHKKKPGAAKTVKSGKQAGNLENPSWNLPPSWRVSMLETRDPYGWHVLDRAKLEEIVGKLREFERQTWKQIIGEDVDRNHHIPRTRLCKAAQDRLEEMKLDDIDKLLSLRLSGPERIYGILENGALKLLWWDPKHEICEVPKRYT